MKFSQIALSIYMFALVVVASSPELTFIEDLLGIALVGVFIIESLFTRGARLEWHWSINWMLFFALYAFVSLLANPEGLRRFITFLLVLILFYTVFNIVRRSNSVRSIAIGLLAGIAYSLLFNWDQILALSVGITRERFVGMAGNPNVFAFLIISFILMLLRPLFENDTSFIKEKYGWLEKVIITVLISGCAYLVLMLTGSRKGVVLLTIIALWTYFYLFKHHTLAKRVLTTSIAGVIIVLLFTAFQESSFFQRFENIFIYLEGGSVNEGSLGNREGMIYAAIDLWSQKPILGWGFDSFKTVSGFGAYSHSNIFEILSNHGLVGFVLYYGFHLSILYTAYERYNAKQIQRKELLNWSILVIVILLAWEVAAVSYYSKMNWILYGVALAGILNARNLK